MSQVIVKSSAVTNEIFEDLEKYLDFCRDFGYKFNEKELYDNKSYTYRQFLKHQQGKTVVDNWIEDNKPNQG